MQMTITLFDGAGNVVEASTFEAPTATQDQIDDMVAMIEGGTPAHIAAHLATLPVEPQPE